MTLQPFSSPRQHPRLETLAAATATATIEPPFTPGGRPSTPAPPETPESPDTGGERDGRRVRRNLAVLVIAGTAALALGFGGSALMNAFFTAQATVTGQQVTTGTVNVSAATAADSAPIAVTGLLPGDDASTTITVRNPGSEPVYLSFAMPTAEGNDAGLAGALQTRLTVGTAADGPGTTRTLTDWQSGRYQLAAPLAPGAETQITVNAALPGTVTDAALQGKSASFAVNVAATQVKNTPVPTGNGWVAN